MKKLNNQLMYLVSFPWILIPIFLVIHPKMIRSALFSRAGMVMVAVMVVWQFIGVKISRMFVRSDDFRERLKLIPIMLIFFFPPVGIIVFGPVILEAMKK